MKYKPETKFKTIENIVYNIRKGRSFTGRPMHVNDITITVEGSNRPDEEIDEILILIQDVLNKYYFDHLG